MIHGLLISIFGMAFSYPWLIVVFAFQVWMFVHAIRQGEWIWAVFIIIGSGFAAVCYYFFVYRGSISATRGFELPGLKSAAASKNSRLRFIISTNPTTTFSWATFTSN